MSKRDLFDVMMTMIKAATAVPSQADNVRN